MAWVCTVCTVENAQAAFLSCEVCGSTREVPPEATFEGSSLLSPAALGGYSMSTGGAVGGLEEEAEEEEDPAWRRACEMAVGWDRYEARTCGPLDAWLAARRPSTTLGVWISVDRAGREGGGGRELTGEARTQCEAALRGIRNVADGGPGRVGKKEKDRIVATILDAAKACGHGKWMLLVRMEAVDDAWSCVARATRDDTLGDSAKVSARRPDGAQDGSGTAIDDASRLFCIYVRDFSDKADCARVLGRIAELGLRHYKLIGPFKPNVFTELGIYSRGPYNRLKATIHQDIVDAAAGAAVAVKRVNAAAAKRSRPTEDDPSVQPDTRAQAPKRQPTVAKVAAPDDDEDDFFD